MVLDNKGLASAEFLFVTLIVLIIIGGMVTLVGNMMNNTAIGDLGVARIQGEKIATAINTAYINGNGYSIDIRFPQGENYVNFTATVNSTGYVTIYYPNKTPIDIKLVTNNIYQPYTLYSNSSYRIKNNGTITITTI
ncbi:MAG TPA: hypothetical protein VK444_06930 [Methanobacteriaceae archaeon]|nr:hypothetical protein [Methanobacteriaceae archaeon]